MNAVNSGNVVPMRDFRRLIDDLWGAIDPDEPIFCECTGAWECVDCSLSARAEDVAPATAQAATTAA